MLDLKVFTTKLALKLSHLVFMSIDVPFKVMMTGESCGAYWTTQAQIVSMSLLSEHLIIG